MNDRRRRFAPVNAGDEIDLKIEAVGAKGDGIGKVKGFVVFVPGVKEGEEVKVRVTKVFKNQAFAEVIGKGEPQKSQKKSKDSEEESEEGSENAEEESENFGEEGSENAEEENGDSGFNAEEEESETTLPGEEDSSEDPGFEEDSNDE